MHTRLNVTMGPNRKVTGANTRPSAGIDVFHIALTPTGASRKLECSGFSPCVSAYGTHLNHQMYSAGSPNPPASVCVARCGTRCRHKKALTRRYPPKTARARRMRCDRFRVASAVVAATGPAGSGAWTSGASVFGAPSGARSESSVIPPLPGTARH
jgi:hypothetical protein